MRTNTLFTLLFTLLTIGTFAQFDINDSLQGWYPFTGNPNDSSGNNYHGTVNGATLTTDRFGNNNSAYEYDGNGDYIELPEDFDYPERSVVVWMNANTIGTTAGAVYSSDHGNIQNGGTLVRVIEINGTDYLRYNTGVSLSSIHEEPISEGTWYMSTTTVDTDSIRYYLNDVYIGAYALQTGNSQNGNNLVTLGVDRNNLNHYDGKIDDLRTYNRAIDWCEVRFLYHGDSLLPTITANGNDLTSSAGQSYQWNLNDTMINGATSQNYTATQTGSYTVTVIDSFGCEYTSKPINITVVGIAESQANNQYQLFPNPSNGTFQLKAPHQGQFEITDSKGSLIGKGQYNQLVDMGKQAKGIYFIKVASGETLKLVLTK